MKRKIGTSLLVAIMLLVGCQSTVNNEDTASNQGSTSNQYNDLDGYYDDAGYFWLNDGSGYYNSDGEYIGTQVDSDEDYVLTQVDDGFIIAISGSYLDVDTGREECSLEVESNGDMTFINGSVTYTVNIMGEYLTDGYLIESITFAADDGYQYGWSVTFLLDDERIQISGFPVMQLQ
ncbi:MAG: hypothetical protein R3Y57_02455 [Erysipelotrichaceae bacterium]